MLWTVWIFHSKWWKDVGKNMDIKETVTKKKKKKKTLVISKANIEPDVHSVHTHWRRVTFSDETQVVLRKDRKVCGENMMNSMYTLPEISPCSQRSCSDSSHVLPVHFLHWYRDIRRKQHKLGKVCGDSTTKLVASRLHRICFLRGPRSSKKTTTQSKILASQRRGKDRTVIIPCMVWPSPSQDINIIENICRMLKVNLHRRGQDVHLQTDLISAVKEIWAAPSPAFIYSRYHSLPNRIRHVYAREWH